MMKLAIFIIVTVVLTISAGVEIKKAWDETKDFNVPLY